MTNETTYLCSKCETVITRDEYLTWGKCSTCEENHDPVAHAEKNIQGQIDEALPMIKMMGKVLGDNKNDIAEAIEPIAEILLPIYSQIVTESANFFTDAQVDCIIAAVKKLEDNGFTRAEAVALLGK